MWGLALGVAWGQEEWKHPPDDIAGVLRSPVLPEWWPLPGDRALEVRAVLYPPLSDLARPMLPLAGVRVDPTRRTLHRERLYADPVIVDASGRRTPIPLPSGRSLRAVTASPGGDHLALQLTSDAGVELWLWTDGGLRRVPDVSPNPVLGDAWAWVGASGLVVKAAPGGSGALPERPRVPTGPEVRSASGARASSTYEARDLLADAYGDTAFSWLGTSQLVVVDTRDGTVSPIGDPGVYGAVEPSPDGRYLLVDRKQPPWSHRVTWEQFAHEWEVWTLDGARVREVASLPAAEEVPIHGVPTGPRALGWQQSADATLVWVEALDGGDWSVEVPHRDRVVALAAPFDGAPRTLHDAVHRVEGLWWGADGLFVVEEYERARRWRHVRVGTVDGGPSGVRPWFDLSRNDRYADPGSPVAERRPDGRVLLAQEGPDVFFAGTGSSPDGDRPFLDRRSTVDDRVTRVFRSPADSYARFRGFLDDAHHARFWIQSESWTRPPNLFVSGPGKRGKPAPPGEAAFVWRPVPVTSVADPAPELRRMHKEIVTYTRADGVQLSFTAYTPPGWKPKDPPLPTIVHAYPREYSDPGTAGQISGSEHQFLRLYGATPVFLALHGYAVLDNTTMPVIGDPDTAYDTFVEQLVSSAAAAIDEATRRGITDRDRVGVTGHSHGGLMTVTLLAHSDLFRAGVARSGAYNHTIRPFGFQSERRTLWEAEDTYLHLSPVMFAPQLEEPLLLIHGARDENPGTIPFQSERLFEAVRGSGGTARYVSLPFEGHGYQAIESVEQVLAEQVEWFDTYVRDRRAP